MAMITKGNGILSKNLFSHEVLCIAKLRRHWVTQGKTKDKQTKTNPEASSRQAGRGLTRSDVTKVELKLYDVKKIYIPNCKSISNDDKEK